MRSERRLGQMIEKQKATVGLNRGAKGSKVTGSVRVPLKDDAPTLADAGVDKHLADRDRKLAAIPEAKFEQRGFPSASPAPPRSSLRGTGLAQAARRE